MMRVFAVGVGPGSPACVTREAEEIITKCDVVAGYRYTIDTIQHLLGDQQVYHVTMFNQEDIYQSIRQTLGEKMLVIPFTGDVNFSESEVVDRLSEIFGSVQLVPGISSVQVAASRSCIPLDKARVITMHVTGDIAAKKRRMISALRDGLSVILVPRPWPRRPDLEFMPHQIVDHISANGIDVSNLRIHVYENLTTPEERVFSGDIDQLKNQRFSDMLVMVIDQNKPDSYMNYVWQWKK